MTSTKYRPDIDGLRAIAVMAVLLFHAEFEWVKGGFVGVDVFFVISGFLITRLILDEVYASKDFRYGNFYGRRVRRLFPNLLFTVLLTYFFGALLFSPDEFARLSAALLHSIASISNFFFWSESGYFDSDAYTKPLLHTWSLSVEEQFYIFWPALLVLLAKNITRRWLVWVIAALGVVSLLLNEIFIKGDFGFLQTLVSWVPHFENREATIFFLIPFRIFEFAIGGLLVWMVNTPPRANWLLEVLLLVGLAMIGYAVFTFDEETLFPSFNALIPCVGTALLIYAGRARYLGYVLRNPLSVRLGLISYSLYLIHWPLIVFYKQWKFTGLTLVEQIGLCVVAVILATFMYRFIEKPFRYQSSNSYFKSQSSFGLACALVTIVIFVPVANSWATGGWSWRVADQNKIVVQAKQAAPKRATQCSDDRSGSCLGVERLQQVAILGDSHAGALFQGIFHLRNNPQVGQFGYWLRTKPGTLPFLGVWNNGKEENFDREFASLDKNAIVVLHARYSLYWLTKRPENEVDRRKFVFDNQNTQASISTELSQRNFKKGLERTLDYLENQQVVIIGAIPELGANVARCLDRPDFLLPKNFADRCLGFTKIEALERSRAVNRLLKNAAKVRSNVSFLDPTGLFCKKSREYCDVLRNNKLLYRDDDHLSKFGAATVVRRLVSKHLTPSTLATRYSQPDITE